MDALLIISLVLAAAGLMQAGLMLVHGWEHRRFHARRFVTPIKPGAALPVTVIVPCKGLDPDLRANLATLYRQRYPRYELCFAVESDLDPAAAVIRQLARENPQVPAHIVVAGKARDCGQKVHNLICAARAVLWPGQPSTTPAVLAFADSDAAPHPDWLARLVDRLAGGKQAIATGYRWYAPVNGNWPNRLLSAINNTVIAVMGPHHFNLVWGGSWAILAETFQRLGLPEAWQGTVSDDLVVSRLANAAGCRVAYEPHCLVKSSADFDWPTLLEFLRRQHTIVRIYAPSWWHFAFWTGLFTGAVWLATIVLGGCMFGTGGAGRLLPAAGLAYYLAGVLRARWAANGVRPFVAVPDLEYDRVARLNVWGWPVVSLAGWLGVVSAALGRTVVWRGIGYRLDSPQRTTVLDQESFLKERIPDARTATRAA